MKITRRTTVCFAAMLTALSMLTSCGGADMYASESFKAADNGGYRYEAACEDVDGEDRPEFNTEEYSAITENSFKSVAADPLSTFSIDTDTASYSNVRRMINNGQSIPADAVRIEEMINYFRYNYAEPKDGEPFSVTTEMTDCPWNPDTKLMRVGLKAPVVNMSERKPMNLVFLLDVSGSMDSYDKLPLVKKAFSLLAEYLEPEDRISIVTYASGDRVVLEGADGTNGAKIMQAINELQAGGGTAGSKGITTAYEIAEKYFIEGGNNRIMLATDGDLNIGQTSESELKSLVDEKRKNGVYMSVLGFGTGNIKDNKMETLADNGNGSYYYIDSEMEARRVLVEEMGGTLVTVAKDVKIQVEFNPAYVKGYRLIGYENRMLSAEDFADDSKDAGEIGAGHTVTALYEIADMNSTMEFTSADLKYSDDNPGTENGEYLTVNLRYKEPDGEESKLLVYPMSVEQYKPEMTADMKFAAAVAEFGMLLRGSEYKGTTTKDSVLALAEQSSGQDKYRAEFVELVKKYKGE